MSDHVDVGWQQLAHAIDECTFQVETGPGANRHFLPGLCPAPQSRLPPKIIPAIFYAVRDAAKLSEFKPAHPELVEEPLGRELISIGRLRSAVGCR
jgi:hypothetical protein